MQNKIKIKIRKYPSKILNDQLHGIESCSSITRGRSACQEIPRILWDLKVHVTFTTRIHHWSHSEVLVLE
jgi:hypothetical protein